MVDFLVAEKKLGQAGRVPADQHRRQRRDHPAGRRQGRRAREDAQGDFQMSSRRSCVALTLLAQSAACRRRPLPTSASGSASRLPASAAVCRPTAAGSPTAITRTNGENELRVTGVADGSTKTVAFGAQPAFSSDSRWVAVSVGVLRGAAGQAAQGQEAAPPQADALEPRDRRDRPRSTASSRSRSAPTAGSC